MSSSFKKIAAGTITGFLAITALFSGNAAAAENPTVSVEVAGDGTVILEDTSTGEFFQTDKEAQSEQEFTEGTVLNVSVIAEEPSVLDELWVDGIPHSVFGATDYRTTFTVPAYSTNIRAIFMNSENLSLEDVTANETEGDLENVAMLQQDTVLEDSAESDNPQPSNEVSNRKRIAERLGVSEFIDSDGYLKSDFWINHDIRLLNLDEWSELYNPQNSLAANTPKARMARARSNSAYSVKIESVTYYMQIPMPWGGNITNGTFNLSNGQLAFCGDGLLAEPQPDTPPASDPTLVANESVRKVLYYGYNGPANQLSSFTSDQQVIITSELLSYAYTGKAISTDTSGGYHWTNGISNWYSNIQALPTPPAKFKVYKIEFAESSKPSWSGTYQSQPLFYGVVEPDNASAALVKKSAVPQIRGNHYSLSGAKYGLYPTAEDAQANKNSIGVLETNEDGTSNTIGSLEAKTYYVKEISAPLGYKLDTQIYPMTLYAGQTETVTVQDVPMLGEILIHKTDENKTALKGAEFSVYNHSGSSIWFDQNADGKAQSNEIIADGALVTKVVSDDSGECSIKNLSFGEYQIQETKFPDGYSGGLDKLTVIVSQSEPLVNVDVLNKRIELQTEALSENGTHEQQASGIVILKDTVTYKNVVIGEEYSVKGTLMDKSSGKALTDQDGNPITAESSFKAEKPDGSIVVEFKVDASDLAGKSVVVFEDLVTVDGRLVASHQDITDDKQTITFIDIQTEALADNGTHVQINSKDVVLKDTVSYKGLTPGQEYKLAGRLMNRSTGEDMKDSDGNEIISETKFVPETADGEVIVELKFNGIDFEAIDTVVFEKLYRNDIEIAAHEDINDEHQTVMFRTFSVLVNKVDAGTGLNITNNKFEFTSFSDSACKNKILTVKGDDHSGTALFDKLTSGQTIYIKETKAPLGYLLSNEIVKVEVKSDGLYVNDKKVADNGYLYSIVYKNTLTPKKSESIHTGISSGLAMTVAGLAASVLVGAALMRRNRK